MFRRIESIGVVWEESQECEASPMMLPVIAVQSCTTFHDLLLGLVWESSTQ